MAQNTSQIKRKQEFDGEIASACKRVFVKESEAEGEASSMMDLDDAYDFPRTDARRLLTAPCESSDGYSGLLEENIDKVAAKACGVVEKPVSTESNGDSLSSDTCSGTTFTETNDGDDRRGHCSLNSEEMPPHANAFTGALPWNRYHQSSPSNLNAVWALTSQLPPRVDDSSEVDMDEMTGQQPSFSCLRSYMDAKSQRESRRDGPR